jgi:hypothetical protein
MGEKRAVVASYGIQGNPGSIPSGHSSRDYIPLQPKAARHRYQADSELAPPRTVPMTKVWTRNCPGQTTRLNCIVITKVFSPTPTLCHLHTTLLQYSGQLFDCDALARRWQFVAGGLSHRRPRRITSANQSNMFISNPQLTLMLPALSPNPLDQNPSMEGVLEIDMVNTTERGLLGSLERDETYELDMLSWVKRSQKPKTGLARTSRTA